MLSFEKTSTTPAGRDRLRHEAALLSRARHPGVVPLLHLDEQPDRTTIVLARPTDRTLAAAPPTDAAVGIRLVAALAATVADLHRLGIAHRRLLPDHVLVAADQPVLCGFGDATAAAADADRAADDAALRALVDLLVTHAASAGRAGRQLRSLTVTAVHGAPLPADELARRAGRLAARAHPSRPPRARGGEPPAANPAKRPTRRRVAAVLVGPLVVVTVLAWNARPAGHESGTSFTTLGTTPVADTVAPTTTMRGMGPTSRAGVHATTATAPVRVRAGSATYEVGLDGDQVVVADWRCTGEPSAVLLRPSTGEVFVFDALPDAAAPITGRYLATVTGAREIVTDRVAEACPPLTVRDATGTTLLVGAP